MKDSNPLVHLRFSMKDANQFQPGWKSNRDQRGTKAQRRRQDFELKICLPAFMCCQQFFKIASTRTKRAS